MTDHEQDKPSAGKGRFMEIPEFRRLGLSAGPECLLLGLRDFSRAPLYGLFFGAVYALGGWIVVSFIFYISLPFLAFPTAIGFALIAPFVAAGVYEVSRRLEAGQPLSWRVVLGTAWMQKQRDMGWMALITGFAFFIWIDYATIIFLLFFGMRELQIENFIIAVTTTEKGIYFLLLGNISGAIIATIVFSVTVISFPLLLDRDIDFATAMTASVRSVIANPFPMFVWALIIATGLVISIMTAFIALLIVLPVLGHGTWHMYRKVVASAKQPEALRL